MKTAKLFAPLAATAAFLYLCAGCETEDDPVFVNDGTSSADGSTGADDTADTIGSDADTAPDTDTALFDEDRFSARIDEFWGEPPDEETRLAVFDELWNLLDREYAGFESKDVDWDALKDRLRPLAREAKSYGRFYGALSQLFLALHDSHTSIRSDRICGAPRAERPPFFDLSDFSSALGACVTPDDEGQLLVYRVESGNPAGLEPGDVLVGYEDVPWATLVEKIQNSWELPTCAGAGSSPEAHEATRMASVMNNAHLFESLNFKKHTSGEIRSVSTDRLLEYTSTLPAPIRSGSPR